MNGLVSVTFRALSPLKIISLCTESGLKAIEWGGDIHCPPGNEIAATALGRATREAGLATCSYGSYHRLLVQPPAAITPVLETAAALGAPTVRIWAGDTPRGRRAEPALVEQAAEELAVICDAAEAYGLTIALEKHRGSLTEHSNTALELIQKTARPNLKTYWQPNPEHTPEENLRSIKTLAPHISHIHVFHWAHDGARLPLAQGAADWAAYLTALPPIEGRAHLLEFLPQDDPKNLKETAKTLKELTKK